MNRLRSLLAAIGIAVISGTSYLLVTLKPGVTRADLLDAGIGSECDPLQVTCQVRQSCFPNQPKYGTVSLLGYRCDRPGAVPVLITRWPQQANRDCFEPVGAPDTACVVNGVSFDDGGAPSVVTAPDRCACRARGQNCRTQLADGGTPLMNFAQTYPAPFAGAGCVRKVCEEMNGDQGQSMPTECQ